MRLNYLLSAGFLAIGALCSFLPAQQPAPSLIGWRVGVATFSFDNDTLFDAVDKVTAMGFRAVEGHVAQKVSSTIGSNLDWRQLTAADTAAIQQWRRSKGVTMPGYYAEKIPADEQEVRKLFRFAK